MGLFDRGQPADPRDKMPYEDVQQDLADDRLIEEQRARIEDLVAFNSELIRPTHLKKSRYHELLSKDLKVSNLGEEDVKTVGLAVSLIDHAVYMGFERFAVILHCELIGFLASMNSIDGFERKALISQIAEVRKSFNLRDEPKKKGFSL